MSSLFFITVILAFSRPFLWTAAQQSPPPPLSDDPAQDDTVSHEENGQQQQHVATAEENNFNKNERRITLLGLDDILQLERSGIVGLGSSSSSSSEQQQQQLDRLNYQKLHRKDLIEDGFYDPFAADPSCLDDITSTTTTFSNTEKQEGGMNSEKKNVIGVNCWHPPDSTVETQYIQVWEEEDDDNDEEEIDGENQRSIHNDATSSSAGLETLSWGYGGDDPDDSLLDDEEEIDDDNDGDDRSNVVRQRRAEKQRQQDGTKQQQQENLDDGGNHQECAASDDDVCNDEAVIDSSSDNEEATPSSSDADAETAAEKDKPTSKKKKGKKSKTILVDKHWGTDDNILKMRDRLRGSTNTKTNHRNTAADGSNNNNKEKNLRPPVFLLPGLASTRLVSWKHKPCPQSPLLSDIKMLDHVWLNMNLLIQMATIDVRCWSECMTLGRYQSDYDEDNNVLGSSNATVDVAESDDGGDNDKQQQDGAEETTSTTKMHGCKLRPDEGLDSISSLAPGSISSNLLVGGTNTVYAWLIQWLADNLGYDVTSIVALPYDWRLSPDKMESRDGFLTLMRKKIEAAVESNGLPGIMVAHSVSFVLKPCNISIVQCSSQKSNNVFISYLY